MPIDSLPLVSSIMPTANRPAFVPAAVGCFLDQDYVACELIVLDNGFPPSIFVSYKGMPENIHKVREKRKKNMNTLQVQIKSTTGGT